MSVLLVGDTVPLPAGDQEVFDHLTTAGYTVTAQAETAFSIANAETFDLVLISTTVDPTPLEALPIEDLNVPVMVWEHNLFNDMLMSTTNNTIQSSEDSITIVDAAHPLAGGYTGDVTVVANTTHGMSRTNAPAGAIEAARVTGTSNKSSIWGYDTGDTLTDGTTTAPDRRVGWWFSADQPLDTNADGWALFDTAIDWLAGTPGGGGGPTNTAPTVNATASTPADNGDGTWTVTLDGTVGDDGLPNPPGAVTQTWAEDTKPAGATVTITNTTAEDTTAIVDTAGDYTFTLTANDTALTTAVTTNTVTASVSSQPSSTLEWVLTDHLGSTSVLVNSNSGTTTHRITQYPFGAPRTTTGTSRIDQTFTGQTNDPGTGLIDYGARHVDPLSGRFVQADMVVPFPSNPTDFNRYAYVVNNPLAHVDPSGRCYGLAGDALDRCLDVYTVDDGETVHEAETAGVVSSWNQQAWSGGCQSIGSSVAQVSGLSGTLCVAQVNRDPGATFSVEFDIFKPDEDGGYSHSNSSLQIVVGTGQVLINVGGSLWDLWDLVSTGVLIYCVAQTAGLCAVAAPGIGLVNTARTASAEDLTTLCGLYNATASAAFNLGPSIGVPATAGGLNEATGALNAGVQKSSGLVGSLALSNDGVC